VDDTGGPWDEDLAETTRRQNSNLRRLIDAVGTLLAGSRELLKRLQPLDEGKPPDAAGPGQGDAGAPHVAPPDKPQPTDRKKS